MPGGGFANLDFFERMTGTPGVSLVTMLGEGTFHQVHGGTTTNEAQPVELIRSYEEHYEQLRGRRFRVPGAARVLRGEHPPCGQPDQAAPPACASGTSGTPTSGARHGRPSRPLPVSQDLKLDFIDAFWSSEEWRNATWLGRRTHRAPTDLFVYQELIERLRPDWIVETRTGVGGRALFLASICDLVGGGQVLSIDGYPVGDPPEHPRITYLRGDPAAPATAAQAREIVGREPRGFVILGGAASSQVEAAFRQLLAIRTGGVLRCRRGHHPRGKPRLAGVRPGAAVGAAQDPGRSRVRVRPSARALRAHLQRRRLPEATALTRRAQVLQCVWSRRSITPGSLRTPRPGRLDPDRCRAGARRGRPTSAGGFRPRTQRFPRSPRHPPRGRPSPAVRAVPAV